MQQNMGIHTAAVADIKPLSPAAEIQLEDTIHAGAQHMRPFIICADAIRLYDA